MKIVEIGHVTFNTHCLAHSHARNHEFHFILRGTGRVKQGDASYPFSENTLVYCPPGVSHQVVKHGTAGDPVIVLYVQCRPVREHPLFKERLARSGREGVVRFDAGFIAQLDTVKQLFDSGDTLQKESASLLLTSILYRIFAQADPSSAGPGIHQYIDQAVIILQSSIYRRITNDQLAERLHINPSYLIRLFKKHTGTTPARYLTRLKMETASYLLTNTDRPINRIADELGYYDEFHFSKAFKEYSGASPRGFRTRKRSE